MITKQVDKGMFPLVTTEGLTEEEKNNILQVTVFDNGSGMSMLLSLPELWETNEAIVYTKETETQVHNKYPIIDCAMNEVLLLSRVLTMLGGLSGMPGLPKDLKWQMVLYFKYDPEVKGKFTLVKVYRGVAGQAGSSWANAQVMGAAGLSIAVPVGALECDLKKEQGEADA